MKLSKITDAIENYAPLSTALEWDNSGIQIGRTEQDITSVLVCLDVTDRVIKEALANNCQLIISHHPFLFHSIKSIADDAKGDMIRLAVKNNLAIYSSHTPFDIAECGINSFICHKFELENASHLEYYKNNTGIGFIGDIEACELQEFVDKVKAIYSADYVRMNKCDMTKKIDKIAFCCGSGSEYIGKVASQGAKAYITSDCKMNHFIEADELGLALIDVTHFKSERFFIRLMSRLLYEILPELAIFETKQQDVEVLA